MLSLLIYLSESSSFDEGMLLNSLTSIQSQTFKDFKIALSEKFLQRYNYLIPKELVEKNKIYIIYSNSSNPNTYKRDNSISKYLYFMRIGDEFSDNNVLEGYIKELESKNLELIQYKEKIHQNENLPKEDTNRLIDFYSLNGLHNTIFSAKLLTNKTYPEHNNLILFSKLMLKDPKYKLTDKKIIKENNEEKINSIKSLQDYLTVLEKIITVFTEKNKSFLLRIFSQNLVEINFDYIEQIDERQLNLIQEQINSLKYKLSPNNIIYYYFNKYLRTISDVLLNLIREYEVLISVIIPTYNVELYIDDCLVSLLNQSLNDIEIICVDDVSTDSTPDILRFYAKKDSRVKCFFMDKKVGSGGCRNLALKHAKGKYIHFIDSDDWIDKDTLKYLYTIAQKHKTQILMYKSVLYHDNKNYFYNKDYYLMKSLNNYLNRLFGINNIIKNELFFFNVVAWNKLYLKSFLDSVDAKFPENLIHQDNPFFYETVIQADKIYFIDKYYYNYRKREKSITSLKNETEFGVINIIELILIVFLKNSLYPIYKKELLNRLISKFKHRYSYVYEEYRSEFYTLSKEMIKKFNDYYNLKEDFNQNLINENKKFYELLSNTKDHEEFMKLLNKGC